MSAGMGPGGLMGVEPDVVDDVDLYLEVYTGDTSFCSRMCVGSRSNRDVNVDVVVNVDGDVSSVEVSLDARVGLSGKEKRINEY